MELEQALGKEQELGRALGLKLELVQKLGKIDTLFIVDAAHDKAAWFNFGPENDARVRRMWTREPASVRKTA